MLGDRAIPGGSTGNLPEDPREQANRANNVARASFFNDVVLKQLTFSRLFFSQKLSERNYNSQKKQPTMAISKPHTEGATLPLRRVVLPPEVGPVRSDRPHAASWAFWEPKFRRTRASLLLDDVDDIEERHMELRIDDKNSRTAKLMSHKYRYNLKKRSLSRGNILSGTKGYSDHRVCFPTKTLVIPRPQGSTIRFSSL